MGLIVLPVRGETEIGYVRRRVQQVAQEIGFTSDATAEIGVVATELATNLVRHRTVNGEIRVAVLGGSRGAGIEVVSIDDGPGIPDVAFAVGDHHSTIGTIGCGLGAVRRLTDEFDICSRWPTRCLNGRNDQSGQSGTVIATRKWARPADTLPRFAVSAVSRPFPGETANGDAFLICEDEAGLLIAVADGLGHGKLAAEASQLAIDYIEGHKDKKLDELLGQVHATLHKSRGVVLALFRIDLHWRSLLYAAVGNVEARVYPPLKSALVPQQGMLGTGALPRLRVREMSWPAQATLIVHTDGIATGWSLDEAPDLLQCHVATLGHTIARGYARPKDDATIVVAREAGP